MRLLLLEVEMHVKFGRREKRKRRTFGVEFLMHIRMLFFEPVFTFFGGAAEFTILGW